MRGNEESEREHVAPLDWESQVRVRRARNSGPGGAVKAREGEGETPRFPGMAGHKGDRHPVASFL